MLTYPKSTMRVRRMPMHLSSGHVTLVPRKFYPPPLISFQSELGRRADSRWALPQSSSFCFFNCAHCYLLVKYTRCFIKKWHPFSFFHNLLKWLSIYTKFLPAIAEEIPIQNVWLLVKHSLLVVMQLWHHNVQSCLSQMVQYCSQLLPCFDGELNLVHWWKIFIMSALSNIGNEIRRPAIQKLNHLASSVRCCTVLL